MIAKQKATCLSAIMAIALALTPTAWGATFKVTTTADGYDGKCDSQCSLRDAVTAANALPGKDTIVIAAGTYALQLTGPAEENKNKSGDLDIRDSVTLSGAGPEATILDGMGKSRVLQVFPKTQEVLLENLTLTQGIAPKPFPHGGGLLNLGNTILKNCRVTKSFAAKGGGGIMNKGQLTLTDTLVQDNQSDGLGGGIEQAGSKLSLVNSVLKNNKASMGGGILQAEGITEMTSSVVQNNEAKVVGGGVWNGGLGQIKIQGTQVKGNISPLGNDILGQVAFAKDDNMVENPKGWSNTKVAGGVTSISNTPPLATPKQETPRTILRRGNTPRGGSLKR